MFIDIYIHMFIDIIQYQPGSGTQLTTFYILAEVRGNSRGIKKSILQNKVEIHVKKSAKLVRPFGQLEK